MIRFSFVLIAATFVAGAAAAEDVTDAVPGHPGVTYQMLLKQVSADLTKDQEGNWTLGNIPHLRPMSPTKDPLATEIDFKDLSVLHFKEDGHPRLLLFTEQSGGDLGFDALLAAYDDSGKVPRLLDYMNVGGDRFNDIGTPIAISANSNIVIVSSSHDNSNQSYELNSPIFLHGGKLEVVTTIFMLGNATCNYKQTQSPTYSARPVPGSRYYAFLISVEVETTPGEPDCGEGQKPPKYSKKIVADRYLWNDRKQNFLPATGAVERLGAANWKANSE